MAAINRQWRLMKAAISRRSISSSAALEGVFDSAICFEGEAFISLSRRTGIDRIDAYGRCCDFIMIPTLALRGESLTLIRSPLLSKGLLTAPTTAAGL